MKIAYGVLASPVAVILLLGAAMATEVEQAPSTTVNASTLPALARGLLPDLERLRESDCPQLPLVWLLALIQVESGWNPRAYSSAGAAGLLQLMPASWAAATGGRGWDVRAGPPADDSVWEPRAHLAVALPWVCANLRSVAVALSGSRKPISALDGLAVCHIDRCSRVTGSATGIPRAGEAGCAKACVTAIHTYLVAIHKYVELYTQAAGLPAQSYGRAVPYTGGPTGCDIPDPTGTGGCVTGATAWMLRQAQSAFPDVPVSCWDRHAWNPTSDHPLGRACDFTFGELGRFPDAHDVARGWAMAAWARANA
jgi:hypothetical protein